MSEQAIETGLSPGAGMQLAPEAAAQPTAKERLKEITAGIEKGIKDLFASDQYAAYLKTMSKFHNYSLNNIMLIYMQKPDASLVAGFNRWRDQFQRHVLKGEKGIKIIAPVPYKKKLAREKRDPKTNLVMRDENNNPIMGGRQGAEDHAACVLRFVHTERPCFPTVADRCQGSAGRNQRYRLTPSIRKPDRDFAGSGAFFSLR